jgi:hypothetical protein
MIGVKMSKKQLPLFTTESDLSALVQEVGTMTAIDLALMGLFDEAKPRILVNLLLVQPMTSYLAFNKDLDIVSRPVRQRSGEIKFAVDPMGNPQSIVLRSGGRLDGVRLTAGDISVATGDAQAEELFAVFSRVVRRRFQRIKSYYVGSEAAQLLDQGVRLIPSAKSPPLYDLAR